MTAVRIDRPNDPRFAALGKAMTTSRFDALGRMAFLWEYCTDNQTKTIHAKMVDVIVEHDGFAELICRPEIDLGERDGDQIRIKGTKGRIEWIASLRKNGRKGGRPSKTRTKPDGNQKVTKAEPPSNPITTAITIASSKKNTGTDSSNLESAGALVPAVVQETLPVEKHPPPDSPQLPVKRGKFSAETGAKMRIFIDRFARAYKAKYGGSPEQLRDPAIIGKIGHWIQNLSVERAIQLAEVFLQIDYRPIAESQHDLWQFFRNLNRIGNALNTGSDPGGIDWAQVFGSKGAA